MIKKIVSKWFGFEKELKAKDMKIHLREGELEAADVRLKDLETDVKGLEQKIVALKKELQTETALKNEAVQVAVDQKNTIEQLRAELAKAKKTKNTKKK